jgi:phage terminase large subunit-like protein
MRVKSQSGGGGGEGVRALTPKQNFIENFTLPNIDSINKLRHMDVPGTSEKVLQFVPEARTRLFLLFRGAFKSTIITIAHTIQLMLIWPDIRILIASHKKEGGSQKFLSSIKDHFMRNERFRALFPEYCPKPNQAGQLEWGTSEQVTLPNRSSNAIYPEATIEIAGNTTDVTGRHYNYLKIDDIVTRESVTNESMLEKTEEFNALLTFLFDQPEWGVADYSGTCYHFADLYSSLRDSDQITKFILPVWDKEHIPMVPERYTTKGIEAIKNHPSMTSFQFSSQFEMNPVPEEDQTFRPEYWKMPGFYYDKLPGNLKVGVFVDPANKQRKESDYTALMTIGIDDVGDWWLIDIIRDKLTLDQRAKLVLKILQQNEIHRVNYESVGFQSSDVKSIKEMGSQADWSISVNEIKASKQSKEDRIRGLQYLYEQGKVHWPRRYKYFSKYHNREYDMVDVLRREMWMFPKCDKDDLCDVQSFCLRTSMIKASKMGVRKDDDMLEVLINKLVLNKKSSPHVRKNEIPYKESLW